MVNIRIIKILDAKELTGHIIARMDETETSANVVFVSSEGEFKAVIVELKEFVKLILHDQRNKEFINELFAITREEHPVLFNAIDEAVLEAVNDIVHEFRKETKEIEEE